MSVEHSGSRIEEREKATYAHPFLLGAFHIDVVEKVRSKKYTEFGVSALSNHFDKSLAELDNDIDFRYGPVTLASKNIFYRLI